MMDFSLRWWSRIHRKPADRIARLIPPGKTIQWTEIRAGRICGGEEYSSGIAKSKRRFIRGKDLKGQNSWRSTRKNSNG